MSLNVTLANGRNVRVGFTPLSDGSSELVTDNEKIQAGLERHYQYGRLFKQVEMPVVADSQLTSSTFGSAQASGRGLGEALTSSASGDAEAGKKVVKVSDVAAAKDYLADVHGISRTSLRSQKAINECAARLGLEFVY